ncbi:MAG: hypothetical protein HKN44_00005 [Ilumatobacter sp.]|nr:hypothetical protein [Ilumatobacter sp.]
MRRYIAVSVAVATLGGAGCSSSASDGTTTANGDPTTTIATTPPVDTTPPDTAADTTTSPTTTEPPPPPTTDPIPAIEAEVQTVLEEGEDAIFVAFSDPSAPEGPELLGDFFAEDALQGLLDTLGQLRQEGLRARRSAEVPQVVKLLSIPTSVQGDPNRLSARVCRVDAGVIYSPVDDVVINDRVRRVIAVSEFVRVDGRLKLAGGTTESDTIGATTCDE